MLSSLTTLRPNKRRYELPFTPRAILVAGRDWPTVVPPWSQTAQRSTASHSGDDGGRADGASTQ